MIDQAASQDSIFTFNELAEAVGASTSHPPATANLRNTLHLMINAGDRFKEVINPNSRLVKRYARLHVDAQEPLPTIGQNRNGRAGAG